MGWSQIGMSALSTQYIFVPVAAETPAGAPYNPIGDTVQFAFAPTATYVPQSSDWVVGSWNTVPTNILYPYSAKCLVGPSGVINPGIGTYVVYVRFVDYSETPVLIAGQLQIS